MEPPLELDVNRLYWSKVMLISTSPIAFIYWVRPYYTSVIVICPYASVPLESSILVTSPALLNRSTFKLLILIYVLALRLCFLWPTFRRTRQCTRSFHRIFLFSLDVQDTITYCSHQPLLHWLLSFHLGYSQPIIAILCNTLPTCSQGTFSLHRFLSTHPRFTRSSSTLWDRRVIVDQHITLLLSLIDTLLSSFDIMIMLSPWSTLRHYYWAHLIDV